MRIPPIKSGNYQAATVFTLSEALLRRKLHFFLVGKMGKGQQKVVGMIENVQKDLSALLVEKTKKKLFLSVQNHSNSKYGNCQLSIIGPESLN